MHLKSLTLRGFKSFASATTLRFEPGITCVVGPNGSGKSNVVDALAWVMGEQGAKSLRGGKMADVVFAGGPDRPPLGRAEVSLTIDNCDGSLPIDYTEVTLTRTMFRDGGSEYAINGTAARLLDVQELLSDSALGREMHVIVGQGQLDAVLAASPEERRGFVEEAAGVLKHRRRKDKALRKLEATQVNLTRLLDLTAELRRQLKPLGRQAELARRAATIQAAERDARLRLLADDVVQARAALDAERADREAVRARRATVELAIARLTEREAELTSAAAAEAPGLARAQEAWYALASLRERLLGTGELATERVRRLSSEADQDRADASATDPDELDRAAAALRAQQRELVREVAEVGDRLAVAVRERVAAEAALAEDDRRVRAAARAVADRREGMARLAGQVAACRSRVEVGEAELGRLRAALQDARSRADDAANRYTALEAEIAVLDAGEQAVDTEHQAALDALAGVDARIRALRDREQEAERERAAATARLEALELSSALRDGGEALLSSAPPPAGLLGAVAAVLDVRPGYEAAVAAALGPAADALAVEGIDDAVEVIRRLKSDDGGRVQLLLADRSAVASTPPTADRQPETTPHHRFPDATGMAILDVVTAPSRLLPVLSRLLTDVVAVEDLADARAVVARHPSLVAVTRSGDMLAAHYAAGGSPGGPSRLESRVVAGEAAARLETETHRMETTRFELAAALAERDRAVERVDAALARLHQSDARLAAVAEELADLGGAVRAATSEADRLQRAIEEAASEQEADRAALAELADRLRAAELSPTQEPDTGERDRREAAAAAARAREIEVRLALRTAEERSQAIADRAESRERTAREVRAVRERTAARRVRREREAATARAVALGVTAVLRRLDSSLDAAAAQRSTVEAARGDREAALRAVREELRERSGELEGLVEALHSDELIRAEQRTRLQALEDKARADVGVDPTDLIAEYGPDRPVSGSVEGEEPAAYLRAEQERRLREAERALVTLGRVNPLALEEFAALEERARFLATQVEDLRATRRDLLDIVAEVDARVGQIFADAYADTAREFAQVFARLFPGGEGSLVLTEPDDPLTSGIEVTARLPGKAVRRLSLLSGGERSLTAVAFLLAIFKARPSPFYVLDEVEAALDEVNLRRLLVLLEELRESSQLIVVTHQKRTMEIADVLYGMTMRGDGVTTVISSRLRAPEAV